MKNNRNTGILLSYTYLILNTIISIFLSAFIVRTVGKNDFGVYQSMTAFLSYLVLLEFGTGVLMKRNLSLLKRDGTDKEEVDKNISTIWSLTTFLSLIILLASFIFWLLIDNIYGNSMSTEQINLGKKIFIFAAGNTILSFFITTLNGVLLAFENYLLEKIVSITKLLVRATLLVVLLSISSNVVFVSIVDLLLSLLVFITILTFCVIKYKTKFVLKYFDKGILKNSLPLAFAMLLQTIVNVSNGTVDKFCISVMMSPSDVSIYAISMTIFTLFSSIATIPISMFMPEIARNMRNGIDNNELTKSLVEPCRICVLITGLILCGFIVVGKDFLVIVYGESFGESWIYAIIVMIPLFINGTNGVINNVLDIRNKRHFASLINFVGTAINILLTILGIYYFGMIAAAIATAISLVIQTVLLNIYYRKALKINVIWLYFQSYRGIIPFYILSLIVTFAISVFVANVYLRFLVVGLLFVILSFLLILCFGLNDSEKKKIHHRLIKKL